MKKPIFVSSIIFLSLLLSVFLFSPKSSSAISTASLPAANHSIWFGYYLDDSFYGNFRSEVSSYVDTYMVWGYFWGTNTTGMDGDFQNAVSSGKKIIFGPNVNPGDTTVTPDALASLDVAKNYWNSIDMIYFDELNMDKAGVENFVTSFNQEVANRGLSPKPIAINFSEAQFNSNTGYQASNIDYVGLEAYMDPSTQNDTNLVSELDAKIQGFKNKIGNRQMFIVLQAYDRNGAWTNLNSLQSIQASPYLDAYNDKNVVGMLAFAYGRPGGTRDLGSCISTEHKRIFGAINNSTEPATVSCTPTTTPPVTTPSPATPTTPSGSTGAHGSTGYFCPENIHVNEIMRATTTNSKGGLDLNGCLSYCAAQGADACNYTIDPSNSSTRYCEAMSGGSMFVQTPYNNWNYFLPQANSCSTQDFCSTHPSYLVCAGAQTASSGVSSASPLSISTPASLPSASESSSYAATIYATGGTGSYAWSVTTSSLLPPGLILTQPVCVTSPCQVPATISGVPTNGGTYSFSVRVGTNTAGEFNEKKFTMVVAGNGASVPVSPPIASTGIPHASSLSVASGPVGTVITMYGTNFSSTNTVNFGVGKIFNVASSGNSLTFPVPATLTGCEDPSQTGALCPLYYVPVGPGQYNISVINSSNSVSNSSIFTVTNNTSSATTTTPIVNNTNPVPAASSSSYATNPSVITLTLQFGMDEPQVKVLQQYLNAHGFPLATTGEGSAGFETTYFGTKTEVAVKNFQRAHGLTDDGIVGPMTRALMN